MKKQLKNLEVGEIFTFINKVKIGYDNLDSIGYKTSNGKTFKVLLSGNGIQFVEVIEVKINSVISYHEVCNAITDSFIFGKGFNKKIYNEDVEVLGVEKGGLFVETKEEGESSLIIEMSSSEYLENECMDIEQCEELLNKICEELKIENFYDVADNYGVRIVESENESGKYYTIYAYVEESSLLEDCTILGVIKFN